MIILAAGDTLAGDCDAATIVNISVFGMELSGSTETYKSLYQGQLPSSATTLYTATAVTAFIRSIVVVNLDTVARVFTLFTNGTTAAKQITPTYTLQAGESAVYEDAKGWLFYDVNGQIKGTVGQAPLRPIYGPAGCKAETIDRHILDETNVAALSTGRLQLQAIWLVAGTVITSISFSSATTAAGTPTNQLFGLYDSNRNLLATSADNTTTAWAANTIKTLNLTAQYTVPSTGLYYLGISVTATTVPTLKGQAAPSASQLKGTAPILNGTSTTGLTSALPNPAAAITVTTTLIWGCVN